MVIGERFAWSHLPKTGGDTTRELFELLPGLVRRADPGDTNYKHATFKERIRELDGKTLAMNFRRLPAWVLSRAQHVTREGVWPEYTPLPMQTADEMADSDLPDRRLEHFTDFWRLRIDAFLRLEHLRQDFVAFLREFVYVSPELERRLHEHPARDVAAYDHELATWFTAEQLEQMYARNPRWAALEEQLYGNLLLDPTNTPPLPKNSSP
jgi:hypothetical protein